MKAGLLPGDPSPGTPEAWEATRSSTDAWESAFQSVGDKPTDGSESS